MEIGIFDHVISTFFMAFMATLVKWPKQHKNIAAPTGLHLAFSRGTISLLLTTENIFHVPISILAKREAGVNPARSRHCKRRVLVEAVPSTDIISGRITTNVEP